MRHSWTAGILLLVMWAAASAESRVWTDQTGKFKVEAEVVTIKDGKVYLEKAGGTVIPVPLERLSQADLKHLQAQPEHADYFAKHPLPGSSPSSGPKMAVIHTDQAKPGEIRHFPNMGWGVESLAFSPDGALLAVGKMDRALMVYDVDKTTRTAFYEDLEGLGQVESLAFTPDGKKLLSGGYSGRIQIWDVGLGGTLTEGARFVGHSKSVKAIAIGQDGKTVLSGGTEEKARAWDLTTCRELFAIDGFEREVKACFITRNGKQGLATDGGTMALVDMKEGKVLQTMKLGNGLGQATAIAPGGAYVTAGESYNLQLWEIKSGRQLPPLEDNEIQWSAVFLPNGKYLLSGGSGKVNLWEVASQRKIYEYDTDGSSYVQCLACSPDGRHFAAIPGSAGQTLQVFRLPADVLP